MKTAKLTFKRSELIYDIANYSFVEGDIIDLDKENARHQTIDITQDGNVDRVNRVLNLGYAECVEMLYPYTKVEISEEQEVLGNILSEPDEYVINLCLPASFSMTTVQLLNHILHEYLVCKVMADWLSIVNPSSRANWEGKTELIRRKIQTSLMSRAGMVRRKSSVF